MPDYELTPQSIFQNEILAFDVNFFNPKADKITKTVVKDRDSDVTFNVDNDFKGDYKSNIINLRGNDKIPDMNVSYENIDLALSKGLGYNGVSNSTNNPNISIEDIAKECYKNMTLETGETPELTYSEGDRQTISDTYTLKSNGIYEGEYKITETVLIKAKNYRGRIVLTKTFYNGWISSTDRKSDKVVVNTTTDVSSAKELQPVIASWYKAFRNIALVALLSVLVYVGIRITLSSTAGDKAKYKQMLVDWTVAICLIFLMHYIMSFAVTINEKIIKTISSITVSNSVSKQENEVTKGNGKTFANYQSKSTKGSDETKSKLNNNAGIKSGEEAKGDGLEVFIINDKEDVKAAWKTLVGEKGEDSKFFKYFDGDSEDNVNILSLPAHDFMTQARMYGQKVNVDNESDDQTESDNSSQTSVARAGYNIIYVVLVIFTVIFCFTYLKRVIYMAFLTIIAPLVAITYPIDKMNDGKAQAFDLWLKEYIFNLLIQPMHLILYIVLVGSAMKFAAHNIFYAVIALGFIASAEKLLRRFFGFEKANTPGMFAGPAGTALMMSGLSKLMHRPPQGKLGSGGRNGNSNDSEEKVKAPKMNRNVDDTAGLFGKETEEKELPVGGKETSNKKETKNKEEKSKFKLSKGQQEGIDDLKAQGLKPGDREFDQALMNMGIDPKAYKNSMLNNGGTNKTPSGKTPNGTKTPIPSNMKPKLRTRIKKKLRRPTKALASGLRAYGRKKNKKYYGKTNGQIAALMLKKGVGKGLGLGAEAATTTLAASAAGLASITSGDPQKALQNMAVAGASGYALGKGIAGKIEGSDNQEIFDAMKEGYYGDDYKEVQQKQFEKQFAKDEENLKKIEKTLKLERKQAEKVAKDVAKNTQIDGIENVDQALAMYQMQQEGKYSDKEIGYAASYNEKILEGRNTKYMKDREEHRNSLKESFIRNGDSEHMAEIKSQNVFKAMDRYNEFKK